VQSYIVDSRERPLSERVRGTLRLGARYATQVGAGHVFLRACDEVGEGARVIGGRPRVENKGYISIGPRSVLICDMGPTSLRTGPAGRLEVGTSVIMNFGSLLSANQSVKIGDRVSIGQYCLIADTEGADSAPSADCAPIELGNGVWIAARVTVLPGVKIGEGSVITAGSIVSSDIPAGVVAGGIPARVLRKLQPGEAGEPASRRFSQPHSNGSSIPLRPPPAYVAPSRRGVIASDFTIGELQTQLNSTPDLPAVEFECAPFGQVVPTLLSPAPEGRDVLVVWTKPEAVVPTFARRLGFEAVEDDELLSQVDAYCELLLRAADNYKTVFVPAWVLPTQQRGLGMIDERKGGLHRSLTAMNLRLMERLESSPSVFVLNSQRWVEAVGRNAHQPKLWYMGKVPFHRDVFGEAARDIKAALSGIAGGARKLLVLDLDDTVWGGIVGDAGWENLRLGGHDSLGEAFVDFQRAAKDLKRRGVVLAIASKNEESIAFEAMQSHPEMILRREDFVAWRINWQDKARNIAEIATELNLGLQSVVFIDDNPVERARVREELPEVFVPEWPEDKLLYASTLRGLRCFDAPALSREDAERTQLYSAERQRETLRVQVGSIDEWLKSLNIEVHAARLNPSNITRATQLLNKTNQLNLSTKRYTESELQAWAKAPDHDLWAVSVSDRFGDAGLTGIVSVEYEAGLAKVSDLVLSCRVIGRKVEETLLHLVVNAARRRRDIARVQARYVPTKKNKPVLDFLQRSGFSADGDDFFWDTAQEYACPAAIQLHTGEN
jgi:FkbH-like protein